jgi:hypothetical protein
VGSHVRIVAATCFVASGLVVGGIGGALASADPSSDSPHPRDTHSDTRTGATTDRTAHKGDRTPTDASATATRVTDPPSPTKEPTTESPTPTSEPTKPPDDCGKKNRKGGCGSGLSFWPFPWIPWPWPPDPGRPAPGSDGSDGVPAAPPRGRLDLPQMRLPAELLPQTEPADPVEPFGATPGSDAELPLEPISMPVVLPPLAPPAVAAPAAGGARLAPPEQVSGPPRAAAEAPAARPAEIAADLTPPPTSYRVGYPEYLRTAGLPQVAAVAGPGLAGMIVLTGAGGLIGYRQAKAGHAVRATGTARFVN